MQNPVVYVSGCHSDADPSPGVGVARSLREAFPRARLVAVDSSVRSSGLHFDGFDAACVRPIWSELDLGTYGAQVRATIEHLHTFWISGLDVEIDWLGRVCEHPRLLIPNRAALARVRKPTLPAAEALGMRVPQTLPATAPPDEMHRLGRRAVACASFAPSKVSKRTATSNATFTSLTVRGGPIWSECSVLLKGVVRASRPRE
jgi:hypothetical protein